jgi:hypothetical protein
VPFWKDIAMLQPNANRSINIAHILKRLAKNSSSHNRRRCLPYRAGDYAKANSCNAAAFVQIQTYRNRATTGFGAAFVLMGKLTLKRIGGKLRR